MGEAYVSTDQHACPDCGTRFYGTDDRMCPTCHAKARDQNPLQSAEDRSSADYWRAGCECSRVGLCYRCRAAAEIERLDRERAEWASVAATRNLNNVRMAEDRDAERLKRQQVEVELDGALAKLQELEEKIAVACEALTGLHRSMTADTRGAE